MHIDTAIWKRMTKRMALVEQALENINDWNLGVYDALRALSRRHGAACGSDPMCALMLGPESRPRVLPTGIEDTPGFYRLAMQQLSQEDAEELLRIQAVLLELRLMRKEREAKKGKQAPKDSPPGGGMLGF